jgi:hydroxymethylglutaryl-CoA lyase
MNLPDRVRIVEVGPRDGLQNESVPVSVGARVALIAALAEAGCPEIEAGAFVSPRWVPQMAATDEVMAAIPRHPGTRYSVLVPNEQGLERALPTRPDGIAVFAAASETFSRRNINASIAESLDRFAPVIARARAAGLPVRGYVSCVLGCPYEGEVAPAAVRRVARDLAALGCAEISLGDTIGAGTPLAARRLVEAVAEDLPLGAIAVHFHDTRGQALANILACLQVGVATIDSAVAGLGGCPYAAGATGNVATEDVLTLLHGMGIATGIELDRVAKAGAAICAVLGRPTQSRAAQALAARPSASRKETA